MFAGLSPIGGWPVKKISYTRRPPPGKGAERANFRPRTASPVFSRRWPRFSTARARFLPLNARSRFFPDRVAPSQVREWALESAGRPPRVSAQRQISQENTAGQEREQQLAPTNNQRNKPIAASAKLDRQRHDQTQPQRKERDRKQMQLCRDRQIAMPNFSKRAG